MNEPKVTDLNSINFLLAAPRQVSCNEAARCQPDGERVAAHDAFSRLLQRFEPSTEPLWQEAQAYIDAPNDGVTKNDHFQAMLKVAKARGFAPKYVVFDSWYSSLSNLKAIRSHGWLFLTQLKSNRQVNGDDSGNRAVAECRIATGGTRVHLKGFGLILVLRIDTPNGDTEYWATNDLYLTMDERTEVARQAWAIESYHRGLKQHCGVGRCAVRNERAQRNHIGWGIGVFLRLEHHCLSSATSWFDTKLSIIRPAIRAFLASPETLLARFEQVTMYGGPNVKHSFETRYPSGCLASPY